LFGVTSLALSLKLRLPVTSIGRIMQLTHAHSMAPICSRALAMLALGQRAPEVASPQRRKALCGTKLLDERRRDIAVAQGALGLAESKTAAQKTRKQKQTGREGERERKREREKERERERERKRERKGKINTVRHASI
jgi:hypothetical protein